MMIRRIMRPEIKKILQEKGSIDIKVGEFKNGVCYGGAYNKTVTSMEELEEAYTYATSHGWNKKSVFMVNEE